MPHVTVKWFGPAQDWAGTAEERIDLTGGETIGQLMRKLRTRHPKLAETGGARFAVNRSYATEDHVLKDGDEVAVIPPVSGG